MDYKARTKISRILIDDAVPVGSNVIILGWVTRAMIKILTISLGISPFVAVGICFVITVAYAVAAGLWLGRTGMAAAQAAAVTEAARTWWGG